MDTYIYIYIYVYIAYCLLPIAYCLLFLWGYSGAFIEQVAARFHALSAAAPAWGGVGWEDIPYGYISILDIGCWIFIVIYIYTCMYIHIRVYIYIYKKKDRRVDPKQ